jgi:hypothetical protein
MAQEDLDDMVVVKTDDAPTAFDNIEGWGESVNDVENKQAAADAGVLNAAYIRYDVALDAYAARDDIEDLAHKNARDIPSDFRDASFMRTVDGNVGSGSSA